VLLHGTAAAAAAATAAVASNVTNAAAAATRCKVQAMSLACKNKLYFHIIVGSSIAPADSPG
jgi:hypothetical protein